MSSLASARRKIAKLQAVIDDPAAAVGERRNARRVVADLLADHPALESADLAQPKRPPVDDIRQRRREQASAARARTAAPPPSLEELQDRVRGALRGWLTDIGIDVVDALEYRRLDGYEWLDD